MDDPTDGIDDPTFLEGKLLVATHGMGDPRFEKSVIFMCAHSDGGAMGLIVNKPAEDLKFEELLKQLDITIDDELPHPPIHFGGPVEHARGFVLHTSDYSNEGSTMPVEGGFGMTATLDILRDIARGGGPRQSLLALGYAGWGPGQLEREFRANGWLTCDADETILFDVRPQDRWLAAMSRLGIDPRLLSSEGGQA